MTQAPSAPADGEPVDPAAFLAGGGLAGELMRAVAWERTVIGPVESWPMSLRAIVAMMLHSRHPMFLWWGPELIQFFNDAFAPSFGAGKLPAAMGQRGAECWEEVWPVVWPQIDDVMSRGKASWNEDRLVPIFRNGRIEDVYWTYGYSPVFDERRAVAGTLVVCTETTARVLAERRLRTSSALASRLTSAGDSASLVRAVGEVLEGAAADVPFAALVREGPTAGDGLACSVRLGPDGWRAIEPAARAGSARPEGERVLLLEGTGLAPDVEAFVVSAGASTRLVFGLSARLPFDDSYREHLARLAAHVAMAEAHLEAQHIRAATQRARDNLLLQAPVATALVTGPTHVFELVNPVYERMVGRRNLVGQTYEEAFPEVVGTALPGVLDRVYRTGEPFVAEEYPVALDVRGDGTLEPRYFRFNLEAMRDGEGRVFGMMVVALDITEQVTARHILERSRAEREGLLTELETAARAKDEFLAMLGHELRNPLAPIRTALDVMRLQPSAGDEAARLVVERQVGHMVRLVDDLLDVSRIAKGKVELDLRRVELAVPVGKAVEMASPLLELSGQRLAVRVPTRGLSVEGDVTRLAQVISNLLANASKYTERGGAITVTAEAVGAEVVLQVLDTGIGITAELLPRIFGMFVQGRQALDRSQGGLGLGLAIVHNLVLAHGGTVHAHSDGPGRGSAFTIRLPVARADGPAPADEVLPTPAEGTLPSAGLQILVVDDNADAGTLLSLYLTKLGHSVRVVYDGPSALEALEDFTPELAFLDLGLPIMDGYELARRLRQRPGLEALRLVAVTGYGQDTDRRRSAAAGFDLHLVKPVGRDVLREVLAGRVPRGAGRG